eukprot:8867662-Pyramimonas_sp.AAC.1
MAPPLGRSGAAGGGGGRGGIFGVPNRCGDRPCGDLQIPTDLTARCVTARFVDLGGPILSLIHI